MSQIDLDKNFIHTLEEQVWLDIAKTRRSLAIIEIFLKNLEDRSDNHLKNRNLPITNALWNAAIESVVISLGRLLGISNKQNECTLSRYRNAVIQYLSKQKLNNDVSRFSKECFINLRNKNFIRELKKKHEKYYSQIKDWRDKVVAHSELDVNISLPKNLPEIIEYAENVHGLCHSAMDDAGMAGQYMNDSFKKVSDDWVSSLATRQNN